MKKIFGLFVVLILQFTFLSFNMAYSDPILFEISSDGVVHVSNEIIVQFKSGTANQKIQALNEQHGSFVMDISQKGKFIKLKVPSDKSAEEFAEIYNKLPDVKTAEINPIGAAFLIPNDGYYSYQWHYPRINMENAWDIETGDPAVIVAVIDTGIAFENYGSYLKAPDFAGTSFVSGYDFVNNDSHPNDDNGHGTHVAGTVAQTTNNGVGVAGMCHKCTLMPIKVLNSNGFGSAYDIAKGIEWATDHGAKIINLSLGFDPGVNPGSSLSNAVSDAYNRGVLIVAASGNAATSRVSYPAAYDDVIAVGSVTSDNIIAGYSQYGSDQELVAPGGDSGDRNGDGYMDGVLQQSFGSSPSDFGYYFMTGTSMATPHVAGLAALLFSQDLNRTNIEVRQILRDTATNMGPAGWDVVYGYGRIEGKNALSQINQPPIPHISGPANANVGDLVSFNGSGSYDPEGNSLTYFWNFGDGNSSTEMSPTHIYNGQGLYSVTLKVNDGVFDSTNSVHSIYIDNVNQKPLADAGSDQTVSDTAGDGVESVAMNGSGSQDPDGDSLTYSWTWDGGSSTGMSPSISVSVGITDVTLTVSDGSLSDSDEAQIIVVAANIDPPIANAGADIVVMDSDGDGVETVSLNGSGSTDPNGNSLLYFWVWSGGSSSGVSPAITVPLGITQVSLIVYDGLFTAMDAVQVTVASVANDPPLADAGLDQTITDSDGDGSESISLDGSGSFDSNGDSLTYSWSWTGGSASGASPNVDLPVGTTNVTLTVSDGQYSDSDSVRVTIIAIEGNNRPIADAGSDVTLTDTDNDGFESVSLDGSNSSDPDGDNLSYYWLWQGGEANGVNPTITLPVGITSVTLIVFDGEFINYDSKQVTIAAGFVNNPPIADAGSSKSLIDSDNDSVEMVVLDGSGSYDPDGDSLTYSWTWSGGSASGMSPTVVLPVGNTIITLTVSDGKLSDSASMQVTIAAGDPNDPPLANAGSDQSVTDSDDSGFESITLDGSGSSDPDGDSLTYSWVWSGGSTSGVGPTITLPVGTINITLTVSDGEFTAQDSVLVEVLARPNNPPLANAGSDRTVTDNDDSGFESMVLDGSNSSDPDGDQLTYSWTWNGFSTTGVNPTIAFPVGITTVTLTVSDGEFTAQDSMLVEVLARPNNPPIANAGSDRTATDNDGSGYESMVLDGSNSTDPDGDQLTYSWTWNGFSTTGVNPTIAFPVGITTVTLTVSDGEFTAQDSMLVEVLVQPNSAPLANAGSDRTVTDNDDSGFESMVLDGSNSSDPDGDQLTYSWTWNGFSTSGVNPTIAFPVGITTVTLTVSDGKLSDTDSMQVTVLEKPTNLTLATTDRDRNVKSSFSVSERIYLYVEYRNSRGRAEDEARINGTIYDQDRNIVKTLRGETNERGEDRISFTMDSDSKLGIYEIQVSARGESETATGVVYFELTGP